MNEAIDEGPGPISRYSCVEPEEEWIQSIDREKAGWQFRLDYFGYDVRLHTTDTVATAEERRLGIADKAWRSRIRIGLQRPLPGSPEEATYKQLTGGLRTGIARYASLVGRQVPVLQEWSRVYASREEAEKGHNALRTYLEWFACERHLFDDIIVEMEHQRTAFLLGADAPGKPLSFAALVMLRQRSLQCLSLA